MLHGDKLLIVQYSYNTVLLIVNFRIFVASCAAVWYMVTALRMCITQYITKLMVPTPFTVCVWVGGGGGGGIL